MSRAGGLADAVTFSPMASNVARLAVFATAALLAGCGGGSSNKSATTHSAGALRTVVSATNGGFSTVVPPGYTYRPGVAQYLANTTEAGGIQTSLVVVRQPAREGDISTVARQTLRAFRRPPKPKHVSPLRSLSVDREPALAVDYVPTGGRAQHVLLVFVRHGEWVYTMQCVASPTAYPAASAALEELTRNLHWL
jgi:hypothetical protein